MQTPNRATPKTHGSLACILQEEDWNADTPRIVAEEVVRGGQPLLEITVYHLRDRDDPEPDDAPEVSDVVLLPRAAWETLVQLFAYRHPDAAARIVTRAQGWHAEPSGESGH